MDRTIKARDSRNRPVICIGISEAFYLVHAGLGVWHGRKKKEIRFNATREELLAYIRLMRFSVECSPISLDCRTIKRLPHTNFDHARNAEYGEAARALTERPFIGDFPYCDLALEQYMRDVQKQR